MLGITLAGRYYLTTPLGQGGFGKTYLAQDQQLPGDPVCVVKQLQPQNPDLKALQTAKRLFNTEAEVLYKLGSHPQIPQLFAHFEENQEFYLVQEFIEGVSLKEELHQKAKFSENQVISLLQEILEVLKFVHEKKVIHRDIKPANLIRRYSDQKIVLIDFGAVKQINALSPNSSGDTTLTIAIGSAGYMPIEQLAGNPSFSSDIYAVGMVAIQALTGLHPAQIPTKNQEIMWSNEVKVSRGLAYILNKMIRYDVRQRYPSAKSALADLKNLNVYAQSFTQVNLQKLSENYETTQESLPTLNQYNVTITRTSPLISPESQQQKFKPYKNQNSKNSITGTTKTQFKTASQQKKSSKTSTKKRSRQLSFLIIINDLLGRLNDKWVILSIISILSFSTYYNFSRTSMTLSQNQSPSVSGLSETSLKPKLDSSSPGLPITQIPTIMQVNISSPSSPTPTASPTDLELYPTVETQRKSTNSPNSALPKPSNSIPVTPENSVNSTLTSSTVTSSIDLTHILTSSNFNLDPAMLITIIHRHQQIFYLEKNRFAKNFSDLKINLSPYSDQYDYKIIEANHQKVVTIAQAKLPNQNSYIGLVFTEGNLMLDKVCATSHPSQQVPAEPQIINQKIECSSGSL